MAHMGFSSKKKLEEHTRNIIKQIGITNSIKKTKPEYYNFFLELFKRHTDYPNKTRNMIDIIIKQNIFGSGFELNIIRDDNSIEDISWKNCVNQRKSNDLKAAMRTAIIPQIIDFRQLSKLDCEICHKPSDNYEVDHIIHFEKLYTNFIKLQSDIPTSFNDMKDGSNRACFKPSDNKFEDDWFKYHKDNAKLRILCKHCNISRPKWDKDSHSLEDFIIL
jgi:hypothetical protein